MNILSLFDGISCGRIALERAGIKIDKYFASEIDKYSMQVSMYNYPSTIQIGDVKNIDVNTLPKIDLLIGGSPCQNFSFAGKKQGMITKDNVEILDLETYLYYKNNNFEFDGQSYLFWEYIRILKEVKPKYFLLENVVMSDKWKKIITDTIGVEPIFINSRLVSAQERKRLYWTNIPNVIQPIDKNISFQDIVGKDLYCGAMRGRRINPNSKCRSDYDRSIPIKQYIESRNDNKTNCLTTVRKDNVVVNSKAPRRTLDEVKYRWLTPNECEALQTLPTDYTSVVSDNQRTRLIGLGWTVDVIAHIFSFLQN